MLQDSSLQVVNLLGKIESTAEFEDRNCIKVVCDLQSRCTVFFPRTYPESVKSRGSPDGQAGVRHSIPARFSSQVHRTRADAAGDRRVGGHDAHPGARHEAADGADASTNRTRSTRRAIWSWLHVSCPIRLTALNRIAANVC